MLKIAFKAKIKYIDNPNNSSSKAYIAVPTFTANHCNMGAFRQSKRFGAYANSNLFPAVLARLRGDLFGVRMIIKLSDLPNCVTVDTSKFLAVVTITVEDY